MRFLHEARGMDLIVQHDERAEAGGSKRSRGDRRRQQVGRPVRTWRLRAAHRASHHDRLVALDKEVEHESRLLDRVGALYDDGSVNTAGEALIDQAR